MPASSSRLAALLAVAGLAVAGCGTHHGSHDAARTEVSLSDTGCTPHALSVPAGPREFVVTNTGANGVTEFELKSGERIVGEVENLTPGLHGSFSLSLKPGTYAMSCPGGTGGTLTVTQSAAKATGGVSSRETALAVSRYRAYLVAQTGLLNERTARFVAAVDAGDRAEAQRLYASTRAPYESIEPIAEQIADLDQSIDARANDVASAQWSGFHRIELVLWSDRPISEASPYAKRLRADVQTLAQRVRTLPLEPAQIANGAVDLLDEVAKKKVTGEEERYSHTDLADMRANVSGSRAAYDAVAPILRASDPQLARTLQSRFTVLDDALAHYARGDGFVAYDELRPLDVRRLSAAVDALAEPLSQVARRIVTVS